ncbi:hypothetical protein FDG94_gp002 [Pseudomonas phage SM1]|uniref:Uncharacterized protein n=1 Tax=Pseudomonas phage SM1 TaxID=1772332 RepID=A0A0U3CPD3_9CAUD|nr:hypothetical protein FDG94_gp002 [Pseudomonas phage SM1]ALT57995.1 hypothetical protein SM1_02 [Pseudomonas phage SM1]UGC97151.1 hypothetical protein [Pseudomonas phage BHU-1]UGV19890.1 hypothetical protein [Pseudomonas phage Pa BHU-15]UIW13670.1 hypothetical protein [Pseudomonas phage Pa BHU-17]
MSQVKYLRLTSGPKTLTLTTVVGEPLYQGGVIRLTNDAHIEYLIGEGTQFVTEFMDGSKKKWFTDVTGEFVQREKAKVQLAERVEPGLGDQDDDHSDDQGDGEGNDQGDEGNGEDDADADHTKRTTTKTRQRASKPAK